MPARLLAGWLMLVLTLTGCGPSTAPRLTAQPATVRFDEPFTVRGAGFAPGASVALSLDATDAAGVGWSSAAVFAADTDGAVDPSTAPSVTGDYLGVSATGLISTMHPTPPDPDREFGWPDAGPVEFSIVARVDGKIVAQTAVDRTRWPRPPRTQTFGVNDHGFVGTYFAPADVSSRSPAVLVLGGTGGGDPAYAARQFAARGIPALSVAYFGSPGLSPSLTNIALEYFDRPLTWLRAQPQVDPGRVWIVGVSAGSEAAALVAVDRPRLVHGLVAVAPSSVAHCSFAAGCPAPAWLRDGRPVPATGQFDAIAPTDNPRSVIKTENIPGPVLTVCGEQDVVWDSCGYAEAILQRRSQTRPHRRPADELLSYPNAGHGLILLTPYQPRQAPPPEARMAGSTPTANDQALADAWPRVLDYLNRN